MPDPHTDNTHIEELIDGSPVLTEEEKAELRRILPTLEGEKVIALKRLLEEEPHTLEELMERTIQKATPEALQQFLLFLHSCGRKLREVEERAERMEEETSSSVLFTEFS
jgi:hypothetical protein